MDIPPTNGSLQAWLANFRQLAQTRGFAPVEWGRVGEFPLLGFRRTEDSRAPHLYLSAGIHGDEPAGPLAAERLIRDDLLPTGISWTVCPLLNPGGWVAGTRETPDGIDMNRDYRDPRSPEVTAHLAWLKTLPFPDLYLSLHEDWETTGFYLYEINSSIYSPFGRRILEQVRSFLPIEVLPSIDRHDFAEPGYIVHAPEPDDPIRWPEAIFHLKRSPHLSYTFETPSSADLDLRIRAHMAAVGTAVEEFRRGFSP